MCLIVGEEPAWPLQTQRSRDEYAALYEDLRTEELDDPESGEDETLSYEFGHRSGDEEDGTPSTVHEMELDRRTLRRYLHRHSRAIPEFLDERFDHQLGEQPTPPIKPKLLTELEWQILKFLDSKLPSPGEVTTSDVHSHKPFLRVSPALLYQGILQLKLEGYIEAEEFRYPMYFKVNRITEKGRKALGGT